MTKGAIGNLINRYRSVLNKCRLNNMLAKMFVAGTVMLAGPLMAESLAPVSGDSFFVKTARADVTYGPNTTQNGNIEKVKDCGPLTVKGPNTTVNGNIFWDGSSVTVTGPNSAINGTIFGLYDWKISADTTFSGTNVTVETGKKEGTRTTVNGNIVGLYIWSSSEEGGSVTADNISVKVIDSDITSKNFWNVYGIYGAYISRR